MTSKETAERKGKCKVCAAFRGKKGEEKCRAYTDYGKGICPWLYEAAKLTTIEQERLK